MKSDHTKFIKENKFPKSIQQQIQKLMIDCLKMEQFNQNTFIEDSQTLNQDDGFRQKNLNNFHENNLLDCILDYDKMKEKGIIYHQISKGQLFRNKKKNKLITNKIKKQLQIQKKLSLRYSKILVGPNYQSEIPEKYYSKDELNEIQKNLLKRKIWSNKFSQLNYEDEREALIRIVGKRHFQEEMVIRLVNLGNYNKLQFQWLLSICKQYFKFLQNSNTPTKIQEISQMIQNYICSSQKNPYQIFGIVSFLQSLIPIKNENRC